MNDKVYIFHGKGARFSGAVFSDQSAAEEWIFTNKLTGMLTVYPMNQSAYDWAIENKYFTPKKDNHKSSSFIAGFTSASQEHYHYEDGKNT